MARKLVMPSQINVEFVHHMGDDLTTVNAARVSLMSESQVLNDEDKKLIKYLAKNKHFSCFEHQAMTVIISCPLYLRSQIHRHRTGSYNEVSRRYTSDGIVFNDILAFHYQDQKNKQGSAARLTGDEFTKAKGLVQYLEIKATEVYQKLLDSGVSREEARMVLPTSLMTKFYMTMNLRNWMQFLALRLDAHAQWEVRYIALLVFKELAMHFPITVGAMMEIMVTDSGKKLIADGDVDGSQETVLDNPDAGTQSNTAPRE